MPGDLTQEIIAQQSRSTGSLALGCWNPVTKPASPRNSRNSALRVERQKPVPIIYESVKMDCGFRADIVVEGKVVVELKCKDVLRPVDKAQLLSHLRLLDVPVGFLINFHVVFLRKALSVW